MPRYQARIHTSTDADSAFAYISRFDRASEWDPGVSEAEMLTDEPVGPGSRFRLVARFLGRSVPLDYEIVEFAAPARVVLRAETAMIRSTDTITCSTDGSGALVHYDAVLDAKGVARLANPILALAFRRIGDRAAAGLRSHLSTVSSA